MAVWPLEAGSFLLSCTVWSGSEEATNSDGCMAVGEVANLDGRAVWPLEAGKFLLSCTVWSGSEEATGLSTVKDFPITWHFSFSSAASRRTVQSVRLRAIGSLSDHAECACGSEP